MKNFFHSPKITAIIGLSMIGLFSLTGCESAADRTSRESSIKAENFEVEREITGTNTRTSEVLFHYVGRCSLESADSALDGFLEIMCKQGPDEYRKHYERMSQDVHISSTQLGPIDVSEYHTTYKFKPQQLVPNLELDLGND
jgi:hypothetical protein